MLCSDSFACVRLLNISGSATSTLCVRLAEVEGQHTWKQQWSKVHCCDQSSDEELNMPENAHTCWILSQCDDGFCCCVDRLSGFKLATIQILTTCSSFSELPGCLVWNSFITLIRIWWCIQQVQIARNRRRIFIIDLVVFFPLISFTCLSCHWELWKGSKLNVIHHVIVRY